MGKKLMVASVLLGLFWLVFTATGVPADFRLIGYGIAIIAGLAV